MYASKVDGKVLNFAVSGKLWRRSLVMIDEETETLWSQLLAQAMDGSLKGQHLKVLPSVLTDWGSWVQSNPKTTILSLSRTARLYDQNYYSDPARFVIGLNESGKAKAWPFDQLMKQNLVNDSFDGRPVVVYFKKDSKAAWIYERRAGGTDVTFELKDGLIIDTETISTWNLQTGEATDGKQQGRSLRPVAAMTSFRKSWKTFFPDSEYWQVK